MKPTTLAFLFAAGMLLTGLTVYSLTPASMGGSESPPNPPTTGLTPYSLGSAGGAKRSAPLEPIDELSGQHDPLIVARDGRHDGDTLSHFETGSTLHIEGRLGHPRLARSGSGETFVLLEVRGTDSHGIANSAPVNLAIVVDRSGSMQGTRMRNALAGAIGAVHRLHEGDVVSVVTFDTETQLIVPPTTLEGSSRERIESAIRGITIGSDTCLSCGLEEAMAQLEHTNGRVNRVILLSDGDANRGVHDVAGFRAIGRSAQARGVSITTIGVDVDYNEKLMSAIAQESNGRHFFVENDRDLERVFAAEAESVTTAIAADAEARFDLGPGVEVVHVLDRSFRREGDRVVVPLGTFARSEAKTVLLQVRVPVTTEAAAPVVSVDLGYRDLRTGTRSRSSGQLSALVVSDPRDASDLDPVVAGRVERSETASALTEANELFAQGNADEAQRRLRERARRLGAASVVANKTAPAARAADVARDFEGQRAALDQATQGFASPAAAGPGAGRVEPSRAAKSAVKRNAESAVNMGF